MVINHIKYKRGISMTSAFVLLSLHNNRKPTHEIPISFFIFCTSRIIRLFPTHCSNHKIHTNDFSCGS